MEKNIILSDVDASCNLYRRYAMSNFIKKDNIAQLYVKSLNDKQDIDDNIINKLYIANDSIKARATFIICMKTIIKHSLVMGKEKLIDKFPMLKYVKPENIKININESEQIALINNDNLKANSGNRSPSNCYLLICQTMLLEMINENLGDINELLMDLSNISTKKRALDNDDDDDDDDDDPDVNLIRKNKYRKKISSYLSGKQDEKNELNNLNPESLNSINCAPNSTFARDHLVSSAKPPSLSHEIKTKDSTNQSIINEFDESSSNNFMELEDDVDEEEELLFISKESQPSVIKSKIKPSSIKLSSIISSNNDTIVAESASSRNKDNVNHILKLIDKNNQKKIEPEIIKSNDYY